jgi:organic hydroperoxide reductase OsmC/OhrA
MKFSVKVSWRLGDDESFIEGKYSRGHKWHFDGGLEVAASSSPHVVPLPYSMVEAVDPEEALVASASSCHMLWFLSIAAKRKLRVLSYVDEAEAVMSKNNKGKLFVSQITLRPKIVFDTQPMDEALVDNLHHLANDECFIANSLLTEIIIKPRN